MNLSTPMTLRLPRSMRAFALGAGLAASPALAWEEPPPSAPPLPSNEPPAVQPAAPRERLEQPQPVRRSRFAISAEVQAPARAAFGPVPWAYGLSAGGWIDLGAAVLHPRFGVDYGLGPAQSRLWQLSPDFGAAWAPRWGSLSGLLGGGVGVRWLSFQGQPEVRTEGSVIEVTTRSTPSLSDWGFSGYLRGGLLFFRDAPVSLVTCVDVNATLLTEQGLASALVFWVGIQL